MNWLVKTSAVLCLVGLGGLSQVSAQTAIGQLTLTGSDFGYQTVSLYNFSGITTGCGQLAATYLVCNDLNISSWQLEIDFTANVSGLAPPAYFYQQRCWRYRRSHGRKSRRLHGRRRQSLDFVIRSGECGLFSGLRCANQQDCFYRDNRHEYFGSVQRIGKRPLYDREPRLAEFFPYLEYSAD